MSLRFKSFKTVHTSTGITYSVKQIYHYVMPVYATWTVAGILAGWMSDGPLRGRRWPMILVLSTLNLAVCISFLALPVYESVAGHFVLD